MRIPFVAGERGRMRRSGQPWGRCIASVTAAVLAGFGAGCATPLNQDMPRTRAALLSVPVAEWSQKVGPSRPLAVGGVRLAPPVAYEWLAAAHMEAGRTDDAVLALLLSTVLYVKDPTDNEALCLAVFEQAKGLRSQAALASGLSSLLQPDGPQALSGADVARAVGAAGEAVLRCQDAALVAEATREFQANLTPNPSDGSKEETKYLKGDTAFVSAYGLSLLQRAEDWPFIARVLATDPSQPVFHPYIRAIAKADPAMEQRLLTHSSAMVRANVLVALNKRSADPEPDALVRMAGAWRPIDGEREPDLRMLEAGLTDERHAVRAMAIKGLMRQRLPVALDRLTNAVETTAAWRQKYLLFGEMDSPALSQIVLNGSSVVLAREDTQLRQIGIQFLGSQEALPSGGYEWLLSQMHRDPSFRKELLWLSAASTVDGYPVEDGRSFTADRLNAALSETLGKHASRHTDLLLQALQAASPYSRVFLLQAAGAVATNSSIRAELWRAAECAVQPPVDVQYESELADRTIQELKKGLAFNQSINEARVRTAVSEVMGRVHQQSRRVAIAALAAGASSNETTRLVGLLPDAPVARTIVPVLLIRGKTGIEQFVPGSLVAHAEPEVRLAASLLRTYADGDPSAAQVLLAEMQANADAVEFVARVALATRSPALSQAVLSVERIPAKSVAGHLVRRVEQQMRPKAKTGAGEVRSDG